MIVLQGGMLSSKSLLRDYEENVHDKRQGPGLFLLQSLEKRDVDAKWSVHCTRSPFFIEWLLRKG